MKVIALEVFRDKYTKVLYPVGTELEFNDEDRVQDLTSRGLVKVVEEKKAATAGPMTLFEQEFEKKAVVDALKAIGEKPTMNMKEETLYGLITGLDEENTDALEGCPWY